MTKRIFSLLIVSISLFAFNGCSSQESSPKPTPKVRTATVSVVCHNCRASFKVSMKAMKSNAIVVCPICKHKHKL